MYFLHRMDPGYRVRSPENLLDEVEPLHKSMELYILLFKMIY